MQDLFLWEISIQNGCTPDHAAQSCHCSPALGGSQQEHPNNHSLSPGLWPSVFGVTGVDILVSPAGKCHQEGYCPSSPVWWVGSRGASSLLPDFVFPDGHLSFLLPLSSSFLPPWTGAHSPSTALMAVTSHSYQDRRCRCFGLLSSSAACWSLHKDLESCPWPTEQIWMVSVCKKQDLSFFWEQFCSFVSWSCSENQKLVQICPAVVAMLVICIHTALWRWHFRYFTVAGATTSSVWRGTGEGKEEPGWHTLLSPHSSQWPLILFFR